MQLSDLIYLSPYISLGLGGLLVLLTGLLPGSHKTPLFFTALVFILTILLSFQQLDSHQVIENFILINRFTQSCIIFFCVIGLITLWMSVNAASLFNQLDEIFYSLLIFAVLGMSLIPSNNIIAFLLGIELVTIASFCLCIWSPSRYGAIEAASKLMIIAGVASAFLIMGIALTYLGSGTLLFSEISKGLSTHSGNNIITFIGLMFIIIGVGFELALAPFHNWLADFYEGAPLPIVSFIGTIAKLAILAWALLLPHWLGEALWQYIEPVIATIAIISMIAGALLALKQTNIKRLLAYSSVSHLGIMLIPLALYQPTSFTVIIYYGVSYTLMTFAAMSILNSLESDQQTITLEGLRGIGRRQPIIGICMTFVILSLAGIPPLSGFFSKFLVLQITLNNAEYAFAIIIILSSAVALYYYLRLILVLYQQPDETLSLQVKPHTIPPLNGLLYWSNHIFIIFATLTVIALGIWAQPFIAYAMGIIY
ncbi:NADH-quinone oxidoreductase subunit N [Shewanella surugensis]|uniref:NADH-quinone oxidoreductase subunit N n=1 Tax=Shewanella surugensis TaxID=212020 RepID=A0ABT0L8R3_9GAMM|nr:NADH-quinone oxidoreductase subunit N [Shewanella surugensis]MCL1124084.1 NADH-quinone oxidoreductase subunit N [Shewanella surugensis]